MPQTRSTCASSTCRHPSRHRHHHEDRPGHARRKLEDVRAARACWPALRGRCRHAARVSRDRHRPRRHAIITAKRRSCIVRTPGTAAGVYRRPLSFTVTVAALSDRHGVRRQRFASATSFRSGGREVRARHQKETRRPSAPAASAVLVSPASRSPTFSAATEFCIRSCTRRQRIDVGAGPARREAGAAPLDAGAPTSARARSRRARVAAPRRSGQPARCAAGRRPKRVAAHGDRFIVRASRRSARPGACCSMRTRRSRLPADA